MVLHIGLYFLFLITSVQISICLWLPNTSRGYLHSQRHGTMVCASLKEKKKFAQPLILILSTKKDIEVNALQFCKCLQNTYAQS